MQILLDFLCSNYIYLVLLMGSVVLLHIAKKHLEPRAFRGTLQLMAMTLILTLVYFWELQLHQEETYSVLRLVLLVVYFILKPASFWALGGILTENRRLHLTIAIPLGINAIIYLSTFFCGIGLTMNEKNEVTFGPLGWFSVALSLFYVLYASVISGRMLKKDRVNSLTLHLLVFGNVGAYAVEIFQKHSNVSNSTLMASVCFYFVTVGFGLMRSEISDQELKLREQKVALSMSQLQPHFISNGMVAVRVLIKNNPDKAVEAIGYFIDYLRRTIDFLDTTRPVNISDEMKFVKDYLYIEQLRFGDTLQYEVIEEDGNYTLPAFSVQPLVENSVRHGIRQRRRGEGKVIVRLFADETSHYIRVDDDGIGFLVGEPSKRSDRHAHVGLRNTQYRIREVCHGDLTVTSIPGTGTSILIRIPKRPGEMGMMDYLNREK